MKIVTKDYIGELTWRDWIALPIGLLGLGICYIAVCIGARFTAWRVRNLFYL